MSASIQKPIAGAPSGADDVRQRMQSLSVRYLQRTQTEVLELERMTGGLQASGLAGLKDIELLSHRIRGSGAVFGFIAISDAAAAIEKLAVELLQSDKSFDAQGVANRLVDLCAELARQVQSTILQAKE